MSKLLILGNTAPIEVRKLDENSDQVERVPLEGSSETSFAIPGDVKLAEAVQTVVATFDGYHSDDPPEWVEGTDPILCQAIAEHYTTEDHEVSIGRPKSTSKKGD